MLLGAFLACTRLILHDCSCTLLMPGIYQAVKKNNSEKNKQQQGIPRKRGRVACLYGNDPKDLYLKAYCYKDGNDSKNAPKMILSKMSPLIRNP